VTYNAVSTIFKVLKRITPNVWQNVEEVIILDDASPDPTFELAVGIQSVRSVMGVVLGYSPLLVLRMARMIGFGGLRRPMACQCQRPMESGE
jgi:hypothetical protein